MRRHWQRRARVKRLEVCTRLKPVGCARLKPVGCARVAVLLVATLARMLLEVEAKAEATTFESHQRACELPE